MDTALFESINGLAGHVGEYADIGLAVRKTARLHRTEFPMPFVREPAREGLVAW